MEQIKFRVMHEELLELGFNIAQLSIELGYNRAMLSNVSQKNLSLRKINTFCALLKKKAALMERFTFERYELDSFLEVIGVKESWLARQLCITRQALNKHKLAGFSEARKKKIEQVINSRGTKLRKIVERFC